ncbi:MAG TPA: asparagine synthase (glutamine-hydrolyzing) [Cyclobacteriaceae bacterium]|jgi:asparagine synthase (glutamine-hydrolysing)|nr:asparagine synthase (glutamine-hydrolyzing) [Cyclobacteriaceae bacterium]
MCGIAGIVSLKEVQQEEIKLMTDSIAHRGPDAKGYYLNNSIALGHRRLSIIDLDARSNQPFFSKDNRYVIVFNGEIYNFKKIAEELAQHAIALHTTSDTEVIIEAFALWGTGFVHKLNGMFSFVIYDTLTKNTFLFRDRVGKKPLYYYSKDGLFLFGSEIKAILKHPAIANNHSVDISTISTFLQLGFIPEPKTFYKDIKKFPAGHYGILSSALELSILPYWNISHHIRSERSTTETAAFNQLKFLVNDSVHSRLVADVPVGIFLSGGIDSSLVAASAAQVARLKTFSIGFKESKFDESIYAEKVARHLNTDHHSYILRESEAVEMIDQYLNHFDELFADTSAIPTMLVSRLARQHVTVALTGDGGDELFLGYGSYTWATRLNNPLWKWASPLIKNVLQLSSSSRLKRAASLFEHVDEGKKRAHIFSQEQYFFSEKELREDVFSNSQIFSEWTYLSEVNLSTLSAAEQQALFDFQFYLRDDLLVKVDRASMFFGLECRSPLLDYRLTEFAVNLPESLKKRNGTTKYLLRKMLYEMVPAKYFNRPKWGFSIPLAQWMKNELRHFMNYLNEDNLDKTGIFNKAYVNNLIVRFMNGEDYLYNRLWVLMIIQKYLLKP